MKHLYTKALTLNQSRIESCGRALQCETDAYSLSYWQLELAKANHLKMRILKRLKPNHNVISIDFRAKKRVA